MEGITRRRWSPVIVAIAAVLSACGAQRPTPAHPPAPAQSSPGATTINDVFGTGCGRLPIAGQAGSLTAMARETAAAAIASTPALHDFAAALRATPTDSRLNGDRGLTVFAPDNDAFDKLHHRIGDDAFAHLSADYDQGSFVPHHIVNQRLTRDNLTRAGAVQVSDGDRLAITDGAAAMTIADAGLPPARVVCGNIPTTNATLFIIDSVLVSPSSQLAHTSPHQKLRCARNPDAHDDAELCVDASPATDH